MKSYYAKEETPLFVLDKLRELKINGLNVKDFGCMGLNMLESCAVAY